MRKSKLIVGLVVLFIGSLSINGQHHRQHKRMSCQKNTTQGICLTDLSENQSDQIHDLKISYLKSNQSDINKLNELQARKITLESAENVNVKELHKCIESMQDIKVEMQKNRVRHMQEVKKVLNDEQLIVFEGKRLKKNRKDFGGKAFCDDDRRSSSDRYGRGKGSGKGNRGHDRAKRANNVDECAKYKLSDDQLTFIKNSRIELMKQEQVLENQLNEIKAAIITQSAGRDIDYEKVDKLIEKQAVLKLKITLLLVDHQLEVRQQLTEEQRLMWDMRRHRKRSNRSYMSVL